MGYAGCMLEYISTQYLPSEQTFSPTNEEEERNDGEREGNDGEYGEGNDREREGKLGNVREGNDRECNV